MLNATSNKTSVILHDNYPENAERQGDSPAALGDDHLGAELVELLPELLALERDLGIVDDAVVLDGRRRQVRVWPR